MGVCRRRIPFLFPIQFREVRPLFAIYFSLFAIYFSLFTLHSSSTFFGVRVALCCSSACRRGCVSNSAVAGSGCHWVE